MRADTFINRNVLFVCLFVCLNRNVFSYYCIAEGNGNPLQCSCLENPRDGGAWGAAVSGVAQSWTRLKRLSSSSNKGHYKVSGYKMSEKHESQRNYLLEEIKAVKKSA